MTRPTELPDFIEKQGLVLLARILDRLQGKFADGFEEWYAEIGIKTPVKAHSLMRALGDRPRAVTELAAMLNQSHPLIINWVKSLDALGLVTVKNDTKDRRRTLIALSRTGRADLTKQEAAEKVIVRAYEVLLDEAEAPIFEALWRLEKSLVREPFADRLRRAVRT